MRDLHEENEHPHAVIERLYREMNEWKRKWLDQGVELRKLKGVEFLLATATNENASLKHDIVSFKAENSRLIEGLAENVQSADRAKAVLAEYEQLTKLVSDIGELAATGALGERSPLVREWIRNARPSPGSPAAFRHHVPRSAPLRGLHVVVNGGIELNFYGAEACLSYQERQYACLEIITYAGDDVRSAVWLDTDWIDTIRVDTSARESRYIWEKPPAALQARCVHAYFGFCSGPTPDLAGKPCHGGDVGCSFHNPSTPVPDPNPEPTELDWLKHGREQQPSNEFTSKEPAPHCDHDYQEGLETGKILGQNALGMDIHEFTRVCVKCGEREPEAPAQAAPRIIDGPGGIENLQLEPITAAPTSPPDQGQTEKVAALPSAEALTLAKRGGGKAADGDNYTVPEIEALQRNDQCEGCANKDGHRCNVTGTYRFDKRSIPKLPCGHFKAAGGSERCPTCGRRGHLQGKTLDGDLKERPQKYKCQNGHEWNAAGDS